LAKLPDLPGKLSKDFCQKTKINIKLLPGYRKNEYTHQGDFSQPPYYLFDLEYNINKNNEPCFGHIN